MTDKLQRPLVGVGVIVETPMGVPLLHRQGSHAAGEWCWPGGHLEYNETVLECAVREVREEIGVCLTRATILPWFTEDFFEQENKHYITLYVCGMTHSMPRIIEPDKCADMLTVMSFETHLPGNAWPLMTGVEESWRKFQEWKASK